MLNRQLQTINYDGAYAIPPLQVCGAKRRRARGWLKINAARPTMERGMDEGREWLCGFATNPESSGEHLAPDRDHLEKR